MIKADSKIMYIQLKLTPATHRKFKALVTQHGLTMQSVLEKAVNAMIDDPSSLVRNGFVEDEDGNENRDVL